MKTFAIHSLQTKLHYKSVARVYESLSLLTSYIPVLDITIMASITFHPQGCASGNGLVTLVSAGSVGTGTCFFNDGAFPNSNPSGGYEVRTWPHWSYQRYLSPSESSHKLPVSNTHVCGIDSRDAVHSVGYYIARST